MTVKLSVRRLTNPAGTFDGTELFEMTQAGVTVVGTIDELKTYIALTFGYTADEVTLHLSGSVFSLKAGTVGIDIHAASAKNPPVDADELGITDSAASYALKKLTFANLAAWIWAKLGSLIDGGTDKATPVDADSLALSDSAASHATKRLTWANIKATLATWIATLGYASTSYVDTAVANAFTQDSAKPEVAYASTSALPANTYSNGTSGLGATLTGTANGPLTIDGVVQTGTGLRYLVGGEATQSHNGWYTLTQLGVVAVSPYILTRDPLSDQAAEIGPGYLTPVKAPTGLTGGSNDGLLFISVAASPFTVGSTSLTFTQVGAAGAITLTGDVTASGSGSIATTIANDAVTYAKMQNVSATSRILGRKTASAGDTEECTLSEILDFIGSAAQGDILYRGSSGWARLAAGTAGFYLKTAGAAANPLWAAPPMLMAVAASDETTALTAGTSKITFINPFSTAFNVTAIVGSLTVAQTSGSIFTVDVNEAGTSLISTKLTIDNTEKNTSTAATPLVISDSSIAAYAECSIDIDQVGDGTAKGLKVYILGYPT